MSRIKDDHQQHAAISAFAPDAGHVADDADDSISIRSRHTLRTFAANLDNSDDEQDDPWSALPRPVTGPLAAGQAAQLTPAQRRQLLTRALLQLVALFVVCLVGLGGTLWLALPVIEPQDKPHFKIPTSFDELKSLNGVLQHYKNEHFARVLLCWFIVYIFLQAFSIPGSMYMSILAGALFGVPVALPLVCTSVATGATICYLISKFLGVVLVALPSWKARIDQWKDKMQDHKDNMLSYLIVIRMMPLPPHNIVNILAPHLGIGIPLFWLSTFFGIFAVSLIHTTIGEKLDQMTSADDFNLFSPRNCLLLGGVCIAVLVPVFVRRYASDQALENSNAADPHGPLFLAEEGEQDAVPARLPDSFRRNLVGRSRRDERELDDDDDDDDELPPRNLSTDNIADHQDAFPSWRDSRIGEDDFDTDARAGVFPDRNPSNLAPASTPAKLKSWLSSNTGIRL
ncbi:hypothetical protein BCV70DRAFT_200834 [Testicularia cyperi]|uniref:VTT domain-containing protein n=1 Tax=Testicularia cyperi TaxID=1882483 RepID=A0A317XLR8_9BASI|nr:hypothetical protein BCV70DRAFT_200834 [Testicularia cyperi]